MDGNQVPQELVTEVGKIFEMILQEVCHLLSIVIRFT
jgi:hypothetical protein